ncbi:MAG: hypothetical protein ACLTQL_12335 [Eisenbergiella sp.]
MDAGSSNTLIEQIFDSVEEFIDGRLVCGAGGGGFLQVILKKGVTKKQVAERLHGCSWAARWTWQPVVLCGNDRKNVDWGKQRC